MKKVLAVLAVVLLFSGAAFASPAELIGMGGVPVQLTELSDNAILNPALLGDFANKVVIGISFPNPGLLGGTPVEAAGLVILSAGPGILSIGAGPRAFGSVDLLDVNTSYDVPDSTFNLGYALDLSGIKAGLSIGYGIDNSVTNPLWAGGVELVNKNVYTDNTMALKVALGVAMDVGMPIDAAVSIALPGYTSNDKYYDAVDNKLMSEQTTTFGAMDIALNAKTTIAEMILALDVAINSLQYQDTDWQDTDLDGTADVNTVTTNNDSSLGVNLLAGKIVKANDNLKVTIASGVKIATSGAYKSTTENKVTSVKTVNNADVSSGMSITVPFNLAVNVNLGKLMTISNDSLSGSVGITKEIVVLNNRTIKSITTVDEETDNQTNVSDLSNTTPVTGAVGVQWKLGDLNVNLAAGADFTAVFPLVAGLDFVYNWK